MDWSAASGVGELPVGGLLEVVDRGDADAAIVWIPVSPGLFLLFPVGDRVGLWIVSLVDDE